jgi:hypothetical protein
MINNRTTFVRMAILMTRIAALVVSLTSLFYFSWDMPLVAGRLGCLMIGVRIWVLELALLTTAAVGFPEVSIGHKTTGMNTKRSDS